ncbi:MAG: succinate dehydrogenase cytochrome b subunit [Sandaracinaceae bacterium]|nr:succinate dehydrogenase cytochrome b subunit [Sandaracinaceae bacterium]
MQGVLTLTRSTIGQKAIVAVTGVILFGFVIGHLTGNLILLAGPEAYNAYAAALKGNAPLLWGTRITLLTSVILHIVFTMQLAKRNASARPNAYQKPRKDLVTTYAARSMVLTGPLLAAFIAFHLAHFTVPGIGINGVFDPHNPYANLVQDFRVWYVSAIYIFANILLGLHLWHGGWSAAQSIGAQHPKYDALKMRLAAGLALFVACGNVFIPIAVQTHIIGSSEQLAESRALVAAEQAEEE